MKAPISRHGWFRWLVLGALLAAGIWLRLPTGALRAHMDEAYSERYVAQLDKDGWGGFPRLHQIYLTQQRAEPHAFLPPTRILFLASALGWQRVTHASALDALRDVSCVASVVTLLLGTVWAFRLGGWGGACGIAALLGAAPLLIHLAHRALIDGFFAFWALLALWSLWEALREPERRLWLSLYGIGLAAMVLTKENAAFAYAGLAGTLALNRWLKIGRATAALYTITLLAPALAVLLLITCAGGIHTLIDVYRLNIQKSLILPYAIANGDGPWHRYLLDFLLVSPAVTLLALGALGGTPWNEPLKRFLTLFFLISYVFMAQVRFGMNMRYGAMWEWPLCWLAWTEIQALAARWQEKWKRSVLALSVCLVSALELQQYHRLFVEAVVYDPVAGTLTQSLRMFKPVARPGNP